MNKKIIWLIVSCLMVVALVLASCAPAVVEEKEAKVVTKEPEKKAEEVEEVEEVVGPQHGGTLTMLMYSSQWDPSGFDLGAGLWGVNSWVAPYTEWLITGDVIKSGPRGTDEYSFMVPWNIPEEFLIGELAESWEWIDPVTLVFHIRPGVMWAGKEGVMESRELTAYDAEFALNRNKKSMTGGFYMWFVDSFEATDRYTLVVHTSQFSGTWPVVVGYGAFTGIYPPEVVEAGIEDWKNQVGTGPFILTDYVEGSQVTYRRNPYWWNQKQTIDGKEYILPFIDKLAFPIITDDSTRLAALRTGKIDLSTKVPARYKDTLAGTSPELISKKWLNPDPIIVRFQSQYGPFVDNINLRRAMMIGTDKEAILDAVYAEGIVQSSPYLAALPHSVYTPLEELSAPTQELYEYNPEKAKQMIIDLGYPKGFKFTLNIGDYPPGAHDVAAMLVSQWEKIGVEATIKVHEWGALASILWSTSEYDGCILDAGGSSPALNVILERAQSPRFGGLWEDEYFVDTVLEATATMDVTERNAMVKELGIYELSQVWVIPIGAYYEVCYYWPWVKNYYGEIENGGINYTHLLAHLWIDQDLKTKMGY